MKIKEQFDQDVIVALSFLSDKVHSWVHSYHYDEQLDQKVILLKEKTDLKKFCHLLAATGVFSEDDERLSIRFFHS